MIAQKQNKIEKQRFDRDQVRKRKGKNSILCLISKVYSVYEIVVYSIFNNVFIQLHFQVFHQGLFIATNRDVDDH